MVFKVVILSGGSGTRLWPLSRRKLPKQFLKLVDSDLTMFQLTVRRVLGLNPDNITVVCNKEHDFVVDKQLKDMNLDVDFNIITEPMGKNTAPAIATATILTDNDSDILVVTSDHVFDDDKFCNKVREGVTLTTEGIVTFGINPTYPETGYGYINYEGNDLIKFVEKPDLVTAQAYLDSGKYLWNSGVFLFNSGLMKSELKSHCNDIYTSVTDCLSNSKTVNNTLHLDSDTFSQVRSESIDYAVMEYHTNGKVLNYDSKWLDIGSFKSLHEELPKDDNGNVLEGDIMTIDTSNCLVKSEQGLVTTLGVNNLVIINQRDTLIVADKDKSQEVKQFVNKLKEDNREEVIVHAKAYRPWGWYVNVEGNNHSGFKVKRIGVYPGKRLSLQSHNHRSEHWVVVKGTAKVQVGHDFLILHANQHVYIPKKTLHRMENVGEEMVEFVETQIGDYLGEDDIIRYEDDFGRV